MAQSSPTRPLVYTRRRLGVDWRRAFAQIHDRLPTALTAMGLSKHGMCERLRSCRATRAGSRGAGIREWPPQCRDRVPLPPVQGQPQRRPLLPWNHLTFNKSSHRRLNGNRTDSSGDVQQNALSSSVPACQDGAGMRAAVSARCGIESHCSEIPNVNTKLRLAAAAFTATDSRQRSRVDMPQLSETGSSAQNSNLQSAACQSPMTVARADSIQSALTRSTARHQGGTGHRLPYKLSSYNYPVQVVSGPLPNAPPWRPARRRPRAPCPPPRGPAPALAASRCAHAKPRSRR
jgi:hypothetical protein